MRQDEEGERCIATDRGGRNTISGLRRTWELVTGLNEAGLPCEMPQGAFYAFPRVTKISKDSRTAARVLLTKAHVATIPGVVFGGQGEGHVRFGYAIDPHAIEEGLTALKKYLLP